MWFSLNSIIHSCGCCHLVLGLLHDLGFMDDTWLSQQSISVKSVSIVDPEPWFSIKMPSYQYRKTLCGDKMIVSLSYLHNGISHTGKIASLYLIGPLVAILAVWYHITVDVMTRQQLTEWENAAVKECCVVANVLKLVSLVKRVCCINASLNWISIDSGNGLLP